MCLQRAVFLFCFVFTVIVLYLYAFTTTSTFSTVSSIALGEWVDVPDFGSNPTNLKMSVHVPANLEPHPAVILAVHGCINTGAGYSYVTNWTAYSDIYGFITIFPETTHDDNCWDVASAQSLIHDGGGDSTGLANMVRYTLKTYHADAMRVFVTGTSSGAMMATVLAATYPDLFAAASSYSGMTAGCLAGSPSSSLMRADPDCGNGTNIKTQAQWVATARAMYPSWTGPYPRMQLWHGTADRVIAYANLAEGIKQWSGLLGVEFARNVTDDPLLDYTKMVFGDGSKLVAYSAVGVKHSVPVHKSADLAFFGIA